MFSLLFFSLTLPRSWCISFPYKSSSFLCYIVLKVFFCFYICRCFQVLLVLLIICNHVFIYLILSLLICNIIIKCKCKAFFIFIFYWSLIWSVLVTMLFLFFAIIVILQPLWIMKLTFSRFNSLLLENRIKEQMSNS